MILTIDILLALSLPPWSQVHLNGLTLPTVAVSPLITALTGLRDRVQALVSDDWITAACIEPELNAANAALAAPGVSQ